MLNNVCRSYICLSHICRQKEISIDANLLPYTPSATASTTGGVHSPPPPLISSMIPTRHHFLYLTSSIPHLIHVVHSLNGDDLGSYDPFNLLKNISMENRSGNLDPYSYRVLTPVHTGEYTVSDGRDGEIQTAETPIALTTDSDRIYMYTDSSVYEVSYYCGIFLHYIRCTSITIIT